MAGVLNPYMSFSNLGGGTPTVSYIGTSVLYATGGGSYLTFPAGTQEGDLVVVHAFTEGTNGVVVTGPSGGWTSFGGNGSNNRCQVAYKFVNASDMIASTNNTLFAAVQSSNVYNLNFGVTVFRGATTVGQRFAVTGFATPVSITGFTKTNSTASLISFEHILTATSATPPTNFTSKAEPTGTWAGGALSIKVADALNGVYTDGTNIAWSGFTASSQNLQTVIEIY